MRPGQNKRMRGRNNNNNNNRKGPNPLTRSYESNGPDVKIRGTAHHIGEKYLQLARDAQLSGDPVMAESYLQHAEHYFRLIAAAQQAQQQAQFGYQRTSSEQAEADEDSEDDDFSSLPDRFASPSERAPQVQPTAPSQPYPAQPYNNQGERQPYDNRGERQGSERQGGDRQGGDRQSGENRGNFYNNGNGQNYGERQGGGDNRGNRNNAYGDRQDRYYGDRQDRQPQQERGQNPDRGQNQDRNNQDRQQQGQSDRQGQGERQPNGERPAYADRGDQRGNRDDRPRDFDNRNRNRNRDRDNNQPREASRAVSDDAATALPAFITAPVRIAPETPQPVVGQDEPATNEATLSAPEGGEDGGFAARPRRRRRPKPEFADAESANDTVPAGEPSGE